MSESIIECRKATKEDSEKILEYIKREEHFKECGIKLEAIDFVVNTTLDQPNYGFFIIAEAKDTDEGQLQLVGVSMISLEFTDWRNGFFYWIQFVYGSTPEAFDALISKIKTLTQEDETCKGMRAVFDGKYSEHWGKINSGLGLDKSHYYIYQIDA